MTKSLNASTLSALSDAATEMVFLMECRFAGGTLYFNSSTQPITYNSQTWVAAGSFLDWDSIPENADLRAHALNVTLTGLNTSVITVMLSETARGREAWIYLALMNNAAGTIIGVPVTLFRGLMNSAWRLEEQREELPGGQASAKITTTFTSYMAQFDRLRGVRCNVHDHQFAVASALANNDTFFKNVSAVLGRKIYWGKLPPTTVTPKVPVPSIDPRYSPPPGPRTPGKRFDPTGTGLP